VLNQYLDALESRVQDVVSQDREASGPGVCFSRRRAAARAMTEQIGQPSLHH